MRCDRCGSDDLETAGSIGMVNYRGAPHMFYMLRCNGCGSLVPWSPTVRTGSIGGAAVSRSVKRTDDATVFAPVRTGGGGGKVLVRTSRGEEPFEIAIRPVFMKAVVYDSDGTKVGEGNYIESYRDYEDDMMKCESVEGGSVEYEWGSGITVLKTPSPCGDGRQEVRCTADPGCTVNLSRKRRRPHGRGLWGRWFGD